MKHIMSQADGAGHVPMRRTITYAAALALNNNDPQSCLDLLSRYVLYITPFYVLSLVSSHAFRSNLQNQLRHTKLTIYDLSI